MRSRCFRSKGGAGHCAGAGPARGFSVVVGHPGVGKSVLRQHIEQLGEARNTVVVSISRTMHTYNNILKQLAESLHLSVSLRDQEQALIKNRLRLYRGA